jgi:hypothetical protein
MGRKRQHHGSFRNARVRIPFRRIGIASCQIEGVNRAAIECEFAVELVHEIFQHPSIAAVPVHDQEVARRQRAYELARHLLEQHDESLDAQRDGARCPIVLPRKAKRYGRQQPQVEFVTPTRYNALAKTFCDHDVGVQR